MSADAVAVLVRPGRLPAEVAARVQARADELLAELDEARGRMSPDAWAAQYASGQGRLPRYALVRLAFDAELAAVVVGAQDPEPSTWREVATDPDRLTGRPPVDHPHEGSRVEAALLERELTGSLLGLLRTQPDADLDTLAGLVAEDLDMSDFGVVELLSAVARLQRTDGIEDADRGRLAVPSLLARGCRSVDRGRAAGIAHGLSDVSAVEWTLIACCEGGPHSAEEVAAALTRATGATGVTARAVLDRSARLRTGTLVPFRSAALAEGRDDAAACARAISRTLPDAPRWATDLDYRAGTLLAALRRRLPSAAERADAGDLAFLAAVLAGADPPATCAFAAAAAPGFVPPANDPAFRTRITDVLHRLPALRAYFPAWPSGRRVRRDSKEFVI